MTEQRLASAAALDALSVEQACRLINTQDVEVPRAVRDAIPQITALIEAVVEGMRAGGRLIYVGAGTSGRLGVLDASECPPTFFSDPEQVVGVIAGGDAALRTSSEGKEDEPEAGAEAVAELGVGKHDTVVGIAAGGTTPYVWGALRRAKQRGASTAMVTCIRLKQLLPPRERAAVVKPNQPLAAPPKPRLPVVIDYPVELLVGPEVVTGSTRLKAGTATKLALNMISTVSMVQLGKVWGNLMVDVRARSDKLRDRATRILVEQTRLEPDAAAALLERAEGRVKVALIMHHRGLAAGPARRLLEQHGGKLRPLIGPPK